MRWNRLQTHASHVDFVAVGGGFGFRGFDVGRVVGPAGVVDEVGEAGRANVTFTDMGMAVFVLAEAEFAVIKVESS